MEEQAANILDMLRELAPLAAVFALLALVTKRRAISTAIKRMHGEARTNFLLYLFNGLVIAPMFLLPVAAVEAAIGGERLLEPFWDSVPEILTLVACIALIDLVTYWRHRLEHSPELWRFHATHHADVALHWFSVQRKHPVSKVFAMLFDGLLVIALGFPGWAIVGAALIRSWWGYFIHADVSWTLGPVGHVLISPAAHRLHHIRDEALMGANYGNTITLWDRLFGTYVDPAPHVDCETGIAEGTRGFWGELKRPWEARYRRGDEGASTGEVAAESG